MGSSHNILTRVSVINSIEEVRLALAAHRRQGGSVGLVPTMGALHRGHGALIEAAARGTDLVAVSIFVNPIQFNDPGDFKQYPRTLDSDAAYCESLGARTIFAPSAQEMYPEPQTSFVNVEGVSEHLCGKFRPGHFRGVATVVLKLLQIIQPDRAYFGEKDAQQLAVIRRMVRDLNVPVEIASVPTVREPDGLALSSRNQRLTPDQRRVAPRLYRALELAEMRIRGRATGSGSGQTRSSRSLAPPRNSRRVSGNREPALHATYRADCGSSTSSRGYLDRWYRLIDNVLWSGV